MIHPNLLFLRRRRRSRVLVFCGVVVVCLFIFYSFSTGARESYLNRASLSVLERYVSDNPRDSDAAFRLAFKLVDGAQDERAQQIMERLVRDHPRTALYQYGLGRVKHARGQVSAAFPLLVTASELDPQMSKAHMSVASVCSKAGLHTEAIRAYSIAEKQGMDIEDDILGWATSQMAVGNYQGAWDRLLLRLEKTPAADELYPLVAEAGMNLKRYDELEAILMRRLKMTQMYAVLPARTALIRVLLAQNPSPVVLESIEKLAKDGFTIQGVDADFLAANAEVLLARRRIPGARKSLADGLKMDPENIRCLQVLEKLERYNGNPQRAKEIEAEIARIQHLTPQVERLEHLVAASPTDGGAHKALGSALLAAGNPGAANEEYHKAEAYLLGDPDIQHLLQQSRLAALHKLDSSKNAKSPVALSRSIEP